MNKYIICILLLFVPYHVQATPVSIEFTGVTAQLFDTPGYLEEGHGAGSTISFGGMVAMNIRGGAKQFTVDCKTFIRNISADFDITDMYLTDFSHDSNHAFMADFTYVFYGDTIADDDFRGTVPDTASAIKRSVKIDLFGEGLHAEVASDPFNIYLTPGTYWLGIEGDPNRGVCYVSNIQLSGYPVPEPAAMLPFIMGVCLILLQRRERRGKQLSQNG